MTSTHDTRPPCPECGGVLVTVRSVVRKSGRHRFMRCKSCGHRHIHRGNDPAAPRLRRFDADTIKAIRESLDGQSALAKRYDCSQELIKAIRRGLLYRDLLPESFRQPPGPADPSCEHCREWLGFEADHPCRFGFPEPVSEGPGFARDCAVFQVVEG